MAEEFQVLNPSQPSEGGGEIASSDLVSVGIVAANMADVIAVANFIDAGGNFTVSAIDGNNSLAQVRRKTAANWVSSDMILAVGEFGFVTDASNPLILKMGDGSTLFSMLPNLLLQGDLASGDLAEIRDDTIAARDNTIELAEEVEDNLTAAQQSAADSQTYAVNSQDWASAPESTPLPGGKVSAEVSAARADIAASVSRLIDRNLASGDENYSAGFLFKKRRYTGSTLLTVTIPAGIYTNVNDQEAWGIYRKEGTGNIKFVAATGADDIVPAQLKASGSSPRRYTDGENNEAEAETYSTVIPIPNITAGKLVVIVEGHANDNTGMNASIAATGFTFTTKLALTQLSAIEPGWAVFEAPLTAFAAADVTLDTTYGNNVGYIVTHWFVIEGHGGAMVTPVGGITGAAASTINRTLAALTAGTRVFAVAAMRGSVGTDPVSVASFSSNLGLIAASNTAGAPNAGISNNMVSKNGCYARATGVASAAGDFVGVANFGNAFARPGIVLFAYPPVVSPGAGAVTLKLEGGRDTLNVANGEAELYFWPDGTTVSIRTPAS